MSPVVTLEQYLDAARDAVRAGGHELGRYRTDPGRTAAKADGSLVSAADLAAEKAVLAVLEEHDPTVGVLAEETGRRPGTANRTWVVDPLDGTANFVRGLPDYAVAVALVADDRPVVSVVLLPESDTCFWAVAGKGAFRDGTPLRPAVRPTGRPVVATGFSSDMGIREEQASVLDRLLSTGFEVREPGSASVGLCRIAIGAYDGYLERGIGPWDVLPGALVVAEAGGVVTAWDGGPLGPVPDAIVAGVPVLHERLAAVATATGGDR